MPWPGTLTRLTVNGSGHLQLDEGAEWGTYETSIKDYGAGQNRIRRVNAILKVVENPEAVGTMRHFLELALSTDGAAFGSWLLYGEGEYTFRAVKYRVTVYGDPKTGQRPEITRFATTEAPADSTTFGGSVKSVNAAPPAAVLLGERFLVAYTPTPGSAFEGHGNEIAIVVEPEDQTFRFQQPLDGMEIFRDDTDEPWIYRSGAWRERDIGEGHVTILGTSWSVQQIGTWSWFINANQALNGYIANDPPANADELRFRVTGCGQASYTLLLFGITASNGGIVKVYLDSVAPANLIGTFDMYSAITTYNVRNIAQGTFFATKGPHVLIAKVDGQNPLSAGYYAWITYLAFWRLD